MLNGNSIWQVFTKAVANVSVRAPQELGYLWVANLYERRTER